MASLTWKKKQKLNVDSSTKPLAFQLDNDKDEEKPILDDWMTLVPSKKKVLLEDNLTKSKRLVQEATTLAEETRYWEAINKFREAEELNSNDPKIFEMKAQALMEVGELFPAVQSAERAIALQPNWADAYQTLGRTQISIGEIDLALKSFCKAYHINPDLEDLYKEDICWARELLEQKKKLEAEQGSENHQCHKCGCNTQKDG